MRKKTVIALAALLILVGVPCTFLAGYMIRNLTADGICLNVANATESEVVFGYSLICPDGGKEKFHAVLNGRETLSLTVTARCGAIRAHIIDGENHTEVALAPESAGGNIFTPPEIALSYSGDRLVRGIKQGSP